MKSLFAMLAVLGLGLAVGCDSPKVKKAEEKMKEAGHEAVEAGKEAGHEMAEEGKEVAHEAAHAVKKGAEDVEEDTK
jgi:hypothetical protein